MNILNEIPVSIGKHIPIKEVILQAGIASQAKEICADLGELLIISDENTKDFVKLDGEKIILPATQKAELTAAQDLSKYSTGCFVAVGSGSLNDIVKYAAHLAGKPYIIFGTAPSMNGYVSPNASLLDGGYKKSFAAHAPLAAYLDLEILAAAPKRLINSGIGDSICRSTAQADVLLSAQVLSTTDYAELFQLLQKYEADIFTNIEALAKTLVFGGLAMLVAKSSAPASQGEHMLAHYMELMQPKAPMSFHGEQIAVTTITLAKLQEKLLAEIDHVEINSIDEQKIFQHFGQDFGKYCREQTQKKYTKILGQKIKLNKRMIEKNLLKSESIHSNLKSIAAPLAAKDIGWDEQIYSDALEFAKYTRDRFTFLDL